MASDQAPPDQTSVEHRKRVALVLGFVLANAMGAIEGTVVTTALPTIATDLGSFDLAPWILIGYLLGTTATTPLWGRISDIYGRKLLYQLSIALFMVGSVIAGAAPSMVTLIVGRIVQGIGAGGMFSLSATIIGDVISPRERGKYISYMVSAMSVATVLGPLVGGLLVDHAHWRWSFFFTLPLGVGGLVASQRTLDFEFTKRDARIDYLGAGLLIVWVSALVVITTLGGDRLDWGEPTMLVLYATSVIGFAWFMARQARVPEPILPLHLFRERIFATSMTLHVMLGILLFAVSISAPLYLQIVTGVSATYSGVLVVPTTLGLMAAGVTAGNLMTRHGRYRRFPIIGGVITTIAALLLVSLGETSSPWTASFYIFLFGGGMGFVMQVVLTATQNKVPHSELGIATSSINFARSLGSTVGSAILGTLLINRLDYHLPRLLPDSNLNASSLTQSPAEIRRLPADLSEGIITAFDLSLDTLYWVLVPIGVLVFIVSLLVPHHDLRREAAVSSTTDGDAPTSPPTELAAERSPPR